MRSLTLEFLDTDVFHISLANCTYFLDPMIDSWEIDLKSFGLRVILNRRFTAGGLRRFEFTEQESDPPFRMEPGLEQSLKNTAISGNVTEEELSS